MRQTGTATNVVIVLWRRRDAMRREARPITTELSRILITVVLQKLCNRSSRRPGLTLFSGSSSRFLQFPSFDFTVLFVTDMVPDNSRSS